MVDGPIPGPLPPFEIAMIDDVYDEMDDPRFHEMVAAGFEHEVECYGIADGQRRRALDPAYVHHGAYLAGHRTGLALPREPDCPDAP